MKKLYLFLFIFLIFLIGCEPNNEESENENQDKEEIKEVVIIKFDSNGGSLCGEYELYKGEIFNDHITDPVKEGYRFMGWSKDQISLFDFSQPINEDLTLYAIWDELYKNYAYLFDEYVPDIITSSIELPSHHDELFLTWSTSNQQVLDNYGILSRPRVDTTLTVYLEVYDEGYVTNYEKDVIVPKILFNDLTKGNAVFGYYSTWNFFGYSEEALTTLDVVNLSFAYVNKDFGLDTSSIDKLLTKVKEVHNHGIRVVLSVQGYGSEGKNFSDAASTDSGRKKLAKSMANYVVENNLDGIDIDWEYPGYQTGRSTAVDKENYTLLIKEIRTELKKRNSDYLITAAIPGGPWGPTRFDLTALNNYLDYFHIMTYDLNASGSCVHHTALYASSGTVSNCTVDESVKYYLNQGVSASKIIVGLAFYGKYTSGTSLGGSGSSYSSIIYTKIYNDYLSNPNANYKVFFDEVAKAPYIIDYDKNIFITYDDERSIGYKFDYVYQKKLGGVMIWEVGEDKTSHLMGQIKISKFKENKA